MSTKQERNQVRRGAKRASYEPAVIEDILDKNFLCHVGYVVDGQCRVIPTAYVRLGQNVYLHGHRHNGMMQALLNSETACITVTELNGLVLARSGFHHSVNYRSVVLFGRGRQVDLGRKAEVLDALIDHLVPGRSGHLRPHTRQELDATLVVAFPIREASAKIRQGPPVDAEADYALDIWAGVLPLKTVAGEIESCSRLPAHVTVPEHVRERWQPQTADNIGIRGGE